MADHSPTPWTARRSTVLDTAINEITDAKGYEVNARGFGLSGSPQATANANLIFQAVNAYYPMLEALRAARPYIEEGAKGFGDPDREVAVLAQIDAALALSKKEA